MAKAVATDYKARVSEQYKTVCAKTGEFFREVVKFGALMNEVAAFIGEARGGDHDGKGLKDWLWENCPQVNYNTAMGYKAMAAKCAKMIGGGAQALVALQGRDEVTQTWSGEVIDVDSSVIERRDALFEQVGSRRELEQLWFSCMANGEGRNKGGRPKGKRGEFVMPTEEESAKRIWSEVLALLNRPAMGQSIRHLSPHDANAIVETLRLFTRDLAKRAAQG